MHTIEQKKKRILTVVLLVIMGAQIWSFLSLSYFLNPLLRDEWGLVGFDQFGYVIYLTFISFVGLIVSSIIISKKYNVILARILLILSFIFLIPQISIRIAGLVSPIFTGYIEYHIMKEGDIGIIHKPN